MYAPFMGLVAELLQSVFQTQSGGAAKTGPVRKRNPGRVELSLARIIEYQGRKDRFRGALVLGLERKQSAVGLASALAGQGDQEEFQILDFRALELISAFYGALNDKLKETYDGSDFPVIFGEPSELQQAEIEEAPGFTLESYEIVLETSSDRFPFQVVFCQESRPGEGPAVRAKVLVAEDSDSVRLALAKVLGEAGYGVTLAEDGLRAVELYREMEPDLVIMDLKMPHMGGLDAMAAIKEDFPQARFIVLTSSVRREDVVTATTLGVFEYMIKPMETNRLLAAVAKSLET